MQANLFDGEEHRQDSLQHNLANAELIEYPQFLNSDLGNELLAILITEIPWRQEHLKIAGTLRAIPRLQCWMGDASSEYGYSGVRLNPCPWHDSVSEIHNRIHQRIGSRFNSVLINYYRNGQDSVAWHADDEIELGDSPLIASVSLGAQRSFELKQKHHKPAKKYQLALRHGSLLVMAGAMQKHWLHQLPKAKGLDEPRINLTFRNIVHGTLSG